jgi:AraC family transcriptional regulator, alkane utilization regulator
LTNPSVNSGCLARKHHRPEPAIAMPAPSCAPFAKQGPASVEHDVLTETLRAIRLTGSVFLNARFSKPFGIITPDQFDAGTPLAHLRHLSIFHLIASGSCTVEIENGERRTVSAGDILLLPSAATHRVWSGECPRMAFAPDLMRPGPVAGLWTLDHGGGGETVRMVCGFIESREFFYAPVFRSLPPVLVERTGDDKVSTIITSTVREILLLADAATPGTELMLGRLMELLFVEVLRRHASRQPDTARGWFAALNDPIIGRTLQLIHHDPARRWTVSELAREAGTSRSVLFERFIAIVGQPPIEYLANWRMQLAAKRLRNTHDSLAAVAAAVGYESEASFNRAFKRITGLAPGRWRELQTAHPRRRGRKPLISSDAIRCEETAAPIAALRRAGSLAPGGSLGVRSGG